MNSKINARLILGAEKLPYNLRYLDELKAKGDVVAQALEASHPKHAARIKECAEFISLNEFKNGYKSLKKAWWCKVRGCPVCDRLVAKKYMGRMGKALKIARSECPSGITKCVEFPVAYCQASSLRETWASGFEALARMNKRRVFYAKGYVASGCVYFFGDQLFVSIRVVFVGLSGGSRYVSNDLMQRLWEESARSFDFEIAKPKRAKTIREALDWMVPCWYSDLSHVPKEQLSEYFESTLNLRRFNLAGEMKYWGKDRKKTSKRYYPSEIKNLKAMNISCMGYLPNMSDPEFRDKYQEADFFYPDCEVGA